MARNFFARRSRRPGLTLLELLLALSLSVLILMTVSMAINLHFRMLDVRRTNVEEAQVARAALKHIADDLRSAVQYIPPDLSGLEAVTGNTAGAAADLALGQSGDLAGGGATGGNNSAGGGGDTGGQDGNNSPMNPMGGGPQAGGNQGTGSQTGASPMGGTGQLGGIGNLAGMTGSSAPGTAGTDAAAELGTPVSVVGMYGSPMQLQFDISRLPRVDEYESILAPDSGLGAVDIPSDIKTVVYFICTEESFDGAKSPGLLTGSAQPSATGFGRGLMRSEQSRAVASWSEFNGMVSDSYGGAKLLAEEVVGLQFQYFDGEGWLPDWNSDDMGGLPVAVEIVLTIQPTYAMTEEYLARQTDNQPPPEQTYRLVVHLPAAQPGLNLPTGEEDPLAADPAMEMLP